MRGPHAIRNAPERLILDPSDPLPSARAFVAQQHLIDDVLALRHQADVFFAYGSTAYENGMRPQLGRSSTPFSRRRTLGRSLEGRSEPKLAPFKPTKNKVENVVDALRASLSTYRFLPAPCWLGGRSRTRSARHPRLPQWAYSTSRRAGFSGLRRAFFTLNGLDFALRVGSAAEPQHWLRFLQELWPDDCESQDTLQEWIGYLLTPQTHFQKIGMLVDPSGPERAPSDGWSAATTRRP